jgi:hypothetical protein
VAAEKREQKDKQGQKAREPIDARVPGTEVRLVRDVLDKQLVDWHHEPLGRVDGIVLLVGPDGRGRVARLRSSPTVLADRLGRRIGRWVRSAARRWGVRRGRPVRIDWPKVKSAGIEVELNLDARETPALALEYWLREKVICHIPGSSFKGGGGKKD